MGSVGETVLQSVRTTNCEGSSGRKQADPSCRHAVCIAWELVSAVSKTRARLGEEPDVATGSGFTRSSSELGPRRLRDITCQMAHSLTHPLERHRLNGLKCELKKKKKERKTGMNE